MSDVPRNSIPTTWAWRRISDFATTATGGTPSRTVKAYFGGTIPWVKSGELGDGHVFETDESLSELGLDSSNAKVFPKGTLCIALYGATVGKLGILEVDAATNQAVCGIFLPDHVDRDYLFHYLASIRRQLIEQGKGGAQSNISNGLIRQTWVPIAPFNEQRRIVAKIEELFSDLDAGVAALTRARANLKRYRAAVLKAAVEGRLLPDRLETKSFSPDAWRPIDVAIRSMEQGWSPKCERGASEDENTWGVIKTTAVQHLSYIDKENKRLPDLLEPEPSLEVREGDLLITRAGPRSRCAVCCLVRATRPRLIVCDKVYRIRCNSDVASAGYLEIVLNAPQILDTLDELKTGISDSGLNLTQQRFRQMRIPLPSLKVQEFIEAEVARLLSLVDVSESALVHTESRSNRLRQSILKQAFEGRLVPL